MVKTLPREPSRLTFLWAVVGRTKASTRSVVVGGRSMYSRAPERIAFTIACGWAMLPMANKGFQATPDGRFRLLAKPASGYRRERRPKPRPEWRFGYAARRDQW